jgi:hypothetical protein
MVRTLLHIQFEGRLYISFLRNCATLYLKLELKTEEFFLKKVAIWQIPKPHSVGVEFGLHEEIHAGEWILQDRSPPLPYFKEIDTIDIQLDVAFNHTEFKSSRKDPSKVSFPSDKVEPTTPLLPVKDDTPTIWSNHIFIYKCTVHII